MRLVHEDDWKRRASYSPEGYFQLETADTGSVPVRLFVTPKLLAEAEGTLYRQIVNATRFPGVKLVCITPDVHYGYGVPVGCVILTDRDEGSIAMGPVGFDIGCGDDSYILRPEPGAHKSGFSVPRCRPKALARRGDAAARSARGRRAVPP